jgi:hypothetical protein
MIAGRGKANRVVCGIGDGLPSRMGRKRENMDRVPFWVPGGGGDSAQGILGR